LIRTIPIVEASPRNTAAAIAFAAFASDPAAILIVTPSDHIIKDTVHYASAIQEAAVADEVTYHLGIKPSKPETVMAILNMKGLMCLFHEKPDLKLL
jgi:mannose-1-phosphate guanylyltransferase